MFAKNRSLLLVILFSMDSASVIESNNNRRKCSVRRALEQSMAVIAGKKMDEILTDLSCWESVQDCIIEHLPDILDKIANSEIQAQLEIYIKTDPYNICNGFPVPYVKPYFGLPPPQQYNECDLKEFMHDNFRDKCAEMRVKKGILPAIIAREVYRIHHPYAGRINPKTGLPIQKERDAHRKHLHEFEHKYINKIQNLMTIFDGEYFGMPPCELANK